MGEYHQIAKLIFEVTFSSQEEAVDGQNEMAAIGRSAIVGAIERTLDRVDTGGKRIRIDQLSLDLNDFDLKGSTEQLELQVEEKLYVQLQEAIQQNGSDVQIDDGDVSNLKSEVVRDDLNQLDLFVYILRNGHLPWWAPSKSIVLSDLFDALIQKNADQLLQRLSYELQYHNVRARVIRRFTGGQKKVLVSDLLNSNLYTESFYHFIDELPTDQQEVVYHSLLFNLSKSLNVNSDEFVGSVFRDLSLLHDAFKVKVSKTFFNSDKHHAIAKKQLSQEQQEPSYNNKHNASDHVEGVLIHNAGLVLLQPFLDSFFKHLGFLDGNNFDSENSQHRAAYLLQYLVWGDELPEEHDMIFEKILCGISPDDVLMPSPTLSKEEKSECHDLLQSVIDQWKALKNTSINGLQTSFLQRDGILTFKDNSWTIHIEKETIDILVDQVPWYSNLLKVKWSDTLLYVDWS